MKILFVFSSGFDVEHSSTLLMNNLIEDVVKRGFTVHYIAPQIVEGSANLPKRMENCEAISRDNVLFKENKKSHLIRRYLSLVKYSFDIRRYLKKQKDADIVYVQSTPTAFWNLKSVCKCLPHIPRIYSVLDMFPGSTIASGLMPNKIMQRFFYSLQKKTFSMATHIMALSDDMKSVIQRSGVPENKITSWDTWFDRKSLRIIPDKENTIIKDFKMDKGNKFYVQYAGNVGYVFDVDTLLQVANKLSDQENIVFQIIARGSQLPYLHSQIAKYGIHNIQVFPLQPVSRISEVYSSCDIEFIPLKQDVMGNSFPSKIAHVMACKKTFICSINRTPFFDLCKEKKIGFCYEKGDIDGIVSLLRFLSNHREVLSEVCNNAFDFSQVRYSRDRNTGIIIDTIVKTACSDGIVG